MNLEVKSQLNWVDFQFSSAIGLTELMATNQTFRGNGMGSNVLDTVRNVWWCIVNNWCLAGVILVYVEAGGYK